MRLLLDPWPAFEHPQRTSDLVPVKTFAYRLPAIMVGLAFATAA